MAHGDHQEEPVNPVLLFTYQPFFTGHLLATFALESCFLLIMRILISTFKCMVQR